MWFNEYVKVPFKDKGRDWEGCDCWGLVRLIYKEKLSLDLPSLLDYNNCKDFKRIPSMIDENAKKWFSVQRGEEKAFDVGVFKMMGFPMHVGLVVADNLMIHCEEGRGTHVNDYRRDQEWKRRLIGFYRHADCTEICPTV